MEDVSSQKQVLDAVVVSQKRRQYTFVIYRLFVFRDGLSTVLKSGMSRGQAGNWHTKRRAGHIVVADDVTPFDGFGIAAVLAADAHFQVAAGPRAAGHLPPPTGPP